MYSDVIKGEFSERDIKIMRKAKAYGVSILSNTILANELFNLTFNVDLDKQHAKELLDFYDDCDEAINEAQMSN